MSSTCVEVEDRGFEILRVRDSPNRPKVREAVIRCKVASQSDDFPFLPSFFARHRCF